MDLSVIVPVYNTNINELKRCLESVEIDFCTYEVLIIDDGSERHIQDFCQDYVKEHNHYVYLRKENGGVSSARNVGITKARGKYISFLDSDDIFISKNMKAIKKDENIDLIFYNKSLRKENVETIRKEVHEEEGYMEKKEIYREIIKNNRFHGPTARLYKRNIIIDNNISFDEKMMQGEDIVFNINYLKYCESIYYVNKSMYMYYLSPVTLIDRWKKNPDLMFENMQRVYNSKKELIDIFSKEEQYELEKVLKTNMEYSLFQSIMDMIEASVFDKGLCMKSQKFSEELASNIILTGKVRWASFLVRNNCWYIMKIIVPIRRIVVDKIKRGWK